MRGLACSSFPILLDAKRGPFVAGIFYVGDFGQVPKWPKGADCKSVAIGFQGSNPCLPTTAGNADGSGECRAPVMTVLRLPRSTSRWRSRRA